jgi:hypothetical protein
VGLGDHMSQGSRHALHILGSICFVEAADFADNPEIGGEEVDFELSRGFADHSETSPMSRIRQAI